MEFQIHKKNIKDSDISDSKFIGMGRCGHIYHVDCIERWLFEDGIRKCENETIYVPISKGIDNNEIIILRERGNVMDSNLKGDVKIIFIPPFLNYYFVQYLTKYML